LSEGRKAPGKILPECCKTEKQDQQQTTPNQRPQSELEETYRDWGPMMASPVAGGGQRAQVGGRREMSMAREMVQRFAEGEWKRAPLKQEQTLKVECIVTFNAFIGSVTKQVKDPDRHSLYRDEQDLSRLYRVTPDVVHHDHVNMKKGWDLE
jgi:hypothetical protein